MFGVTTARLDRRPIAVSIRARKRCALSHSRLLVVSRLQGFEALGVLKSWNFVRGIPSRGGSMFGYRLEGTMRSRGIRRRGERSVPHMVRPGHQYGARVGSARRQGRLGLDRRRDQTCIAFGTRCMARRAFLLKSPPEPTVASPTR